jgi:hypothetical protein
MPRNPEQLHQHSTFTEKLHVLQTARGPGVSRFGQTQSSGVPSQTGQGGNRRSRRAETASRTTDTTSRGRAAPSPNCDSKIVGDHRCCEKN